jgi:hypothetical protein
MSNFRLSIFFLLALSFAQCSDDPEDKSPDSKTFSIQRITVDDKVHPAPLTGVSVNPDIRLNFSEPIDHESAEANILMGNGSGILTLNFTFTNNDSTIIVTPAEALEPLTTYNLGVSPELLSSTDKTFGGNIFITVVTTYNPESKFPILADMDEDDDNTNDLLSVIQHKTFKYFYDFAHPTSGMARERNSSGDMVTSGGSGFGIMSLIVGMERNFINQQQGIDHMNKIVTFLEGADRFHGAWSHWINGNNGTVMSFSPNDNGGDLVETAFLLEGLITFRQYLVTKSIPDTYDLVYRINVLWHGVEWDWYRRENQNVLYWHWSPDKDWIMNHQISGWNEALMVYVLAASSPTHTIPKAVYTNGWARNGGMVNGNTYEGVTLPLGFEYGGPLFFTHYSFLGLDPRELSDDYANYWTQNVNHSRINYKYCVRNPKKYVGYGENCWGLTASDNNFSGYSAHSPTNDLGVISPTAALSSFPYIPEESMEAAKFFYYTLGDKLWGDYGFYDAFNLNSAWIANSYLAIDQGPIVVMIENYRTGLLWDLFMSAPEVQAGLDKLGFTY